MTSRDWEEAMALGAECGRMAGFREGLGLGRIQGTLFGAVCALLGMLAGWVLR